MKSPFALGVRRLKKDQNFAILKPGVSTGTAVGTFLVERQPSELILRLILAPVPLLDTPINFNYPTYLGSPFHWVAMDVASSLTVVSCFESNLRYIET